MVSELFQLSIIKSANWRERWLMLWFSLAIVVCIIALVMQTYRSVELYQLMNPPSSSKTNENKKESIATSPAALTYPIFGSKQATQQSTLSKIKLHGIIHAKESDNSKAIIAVSSNDAKSFKIGDTVSSGIKLHSIKSDHIILNRRGKFETLYINWKGAWK